MSDGRAPLETRGAGSRVLEVELGDPLAGIAAGGEQRPKPYEFAEVLVRLFGEPIGIISIRMGQDGVGAEDLSAAIWESLSGPIRERLQAAGKRPSDQLTPEGLPIALDTGYREEYSRAHADGRAVSVIICTRNRPASLRRSLNALLGQSYSNYEVVVVDNAPTDGATRALVASFADRLPVRWVLEAMPGLSRARNRGLEAAGSNTIAYMDDDELPDPHWLEELVLGFLALPGAGCVTGTILPAELETEAQTWFHQYGAHNKDRGFEQVIFDTGVHSRQHPLYPLPPFGAGGNMAFTRNALETIGGFDPALGAGTPARGAEDTAAFSDILLAGQALVYRPAALVWHRHYAELDDLGRQLYGYGVGLTAYYLRVLQRHPCRLGDLLRLAPRGLRDLFSESSQGRSQMADDFPENLLRGHRRGLIHGLFAYPQSLWQQRSPGLAEMAAASSAPR